MIRTAGFIAIFAATLATGCSDPGRAPGLRPSLVADAASAPGAPAPEFVPPGITQPTGFIGIPHSMPIAVIAAAPDGSAAVTIDQRGGARLWQVSPQSATQAAQPASPSNEKPAAPEPITLVTHGVRDASVAQGPDGIWLVALTDAAGGVAVLEVSPGRRVTERFSIPPHKAPITTLVLPRAERIATLGNDRKIALLDRDGNERARFEQRRFRPSALVATAGGTHLVAVTVEGAAPKEELALQRLRIAADGNGLAVDGPPLVFAAAGTLGAGHGAIHPAGTSFAFAALDPKTSFWQVNIVDFPTGTPRPVGELVPVLGNVRIDFINPKTLIVSDVLQGTTFSVDTSGTSEPHALASPTVANGVPAPAALGGGRRFVGIGSWLAVHDLSGAPTRFIGYDNLVARQTDRNAAGTSVWADHRNGLFVAVPGEAPKEIARLQLGAFVQIKLSDEGQLITVDTVGTVSILNPLTGGLIDRKEVGSQPVAVAFTASGDLFAVHLSTGSAWVFEVKDSAIKGPYVVADGSTQGAFSTLDGPPQLITYNTATALEHRYSLADVRDGIGAKDRQAAQHKIDGAEHNALVGYDEHGRRYRLSRDSGLTLHYLDDEGKAASSRIDIDSQHQLIPSKDGNHIAIVDFSGIVRMFSRADGKVIWSTAMNAMTHDVHWSKDQKTLLIAGDFGIATLDRETGKSIQQDCAVRFHDGPTPPAALSSAAGIVSICER